MGTIEGKVGVAARLLDGKGEILINATDIYPTASTMKVPVLYELYRQVDEGKIDLNQRVEYNDTHPVCGSGILQDLGFGLSVTVRDLAVLMTVLSDNTATDMLIDLVGIQNIQSTMRNLGLDQTTIAITLREMMYSLAGYDINDTSITFEKVRERLTKARSEDKGRATAEEDNDVSSPLDMIRLLTDIAESRTLSKESCADMIEILSRQKYNDIIPLYLPYGTTVAHKTGSIVTVRNDVGIVYAPERPYTIAIMSKQLLDETDTLRKLARISEVIYNYFTELT
jgi:beta-lactamase class A